MDHIVFLDEKARELENLILGNKSMIMRAAQSCKIPYGNVSKGDTLYFVNSIDEGKISARGRVSCVFCYGMLTVEESFETIIRNQDKLQLPDIQFEKMAGKKYLVLIGVEQLDILAPFSFSKIGFEDMGDWLPVGQIEKYILTDIGILSSR